MSGNVRPLADFLEGTGGVVPAGRVGLASAVWTVYSGFLIVL